MNTDAQQQASRRVVVAAIVLGTALLATMIGGDLRERAALPDAADGVRAAVAASSSLVSCFEGVQDDLDGGVDPNGTIQVLHADRAAQRLVGCDPAQLEERIEAIVLPAPAPVTDPARRALRTEIDDAVTALRRAALEAHTTRRAWQEVLDTRDTDVRADVVVAFHATVTAYERARGMSVGIQAATERLHPDRGDDIVRSTGRG